MDAKWYRLARYDSAVVSMHDGTSAALYQRDPEKFRDLMQAHRSRSTTASSASGRGWPRSTAPRSATSPRRRRGRRRSSPGPTAGTDEQARPGRRSVSDTLAGPARDAPRGSSAAARRRPAATGLRRGRPAPLPAARCWCATPSSPATRARCWAGCGATSSPPSASACSTSCSGSSRPRRQHGELRRSTSSRAWSSSTSSPRPSTPAPVADRTNKLADHEDAGAARDVPGRVGCWSSPWHTVPHAGDPRLRLRAAGLAARPGGDGRGAARASRSPRCSAPRWRWSSAWPTSSCATSARSPRLLTQFVTLRRADDVPLHAGAGPLRRAASRRTTLNPIAEAVLLFQRGFWTGDDQRPGVDRGPAPARPPLHPRPDHDAGARSCCVVLAQRLFSRLESRVPERL